MFNSDWPSGFKTTLYCMYPGLDVSPSWVWNWTNMIADDYMMGPGVSLKGRSVMTILPSWFDHLGESLEEVQFQTFCLVWTSCFLGEHLSLLPKNEICRIEDQDSDSTSLDCQGYADYRVTIMLQNNTFLVEHNWYTKTYPPIIVILV